MEKHICSTFNLFIYSFDLLRIFAIHIIILNISKAFILRWRVQQFIIIFILKQL